MGNAWLQGTLILAVAALVARALGVLQRIPLQRILDDTGMASYVMAYNVYFWLLVLATAGIPSALAKMVAQYEALGDIAMVERVRTLALRWAMIGGVVMAFGFFGCAPLLSQWAGHPEGKWAMQALAPALLLFPWVAVQRGYFHGRQRMWANGLSQVGEQVLRVISSIVLAYALAVAGYGVAWAAAGASFGGVFGAIGAAIIMLMAYRRLPPLSSDVSLSTKVPRMFGTLLRLAIPTSVAALLVPTLYLIDSMVTIPMLTPLMGVEEATRTLGVLGGRAQSLAGIPVIFAIALSQSIVPAVSAMHARGDPHALRLLVRRAMRWTLLLGVPMMVFLMVAVHPINVLLFGNANGNAIIVAVVSTVFGQIIMMTSASVLLGMGEPGRAMVHMMIGVVVKIVAMVLLTPVYGVYGIIGATGACFLTVMLLHLMRLRHVLYGWTWKWFTFPMAVVASAGGAMFIGQALERRWVITEGTAIVHISVIGSVFVTLIVLLFVVTNNMTSEDRQAIFVKIARWRNKSRPASK